MNELDKLENYLKEHNIPYERIDKVGEYKIHQAEEGLDNRHQIIVKDEDGVVLWDAICHFGSYGYEQGLLEIMGTLVEPEDGDSVVGYLTSDDVIKRIERR